MSNFKACDELSQEISELKSQKHEINCLLGPLKRKQSAWYYRSKQKAHVADTSEADIGDNNVSDTSHENSVESNIGNSSHYFLKQASLQRIATVGRLSHDLVKYI